MISNNRKTENNNKNRIHLWKNFSLLSGPNHKGVHGPFHSHFLVLHVICCLLHFVLVLARRASVVSKNILLVEATICFSSRGSLSRSPTFERVFLKVGIMLKTRGWLQVLLRAARAGWIARPEKESAYCPSLQPRLCSFVQHGGLCASCVSALVKSEWKRPASPL